MREKFIEWLKKPSPKGMPYYERISYLVLCNGGFIVGSWGMISYIDGYQHGLEQDEAIELMQWNAYFDGITCFSGFDAYEEFRPFFEKYKEQYEKQIHSNMP